MSITDTEVSGWVVNSLKPFFSEQQTILGSAVQADRDGDRDVSGIDICYPNGQHGQKGGNISPGDSVGIFRVSSPRAVGSKSVANISMLGTCVGELDRNTCRHLTRYKWYPGCPWLRFTAAAFCIYKVGETGKV